MGVVDGGAQCFPLAREGRRIYIYISSRPIPADNRTIYMHRAFIFSSDSKGVSMSWNHSIAFID